MLTERKCLEQRSSGNFDVESQNVAVLVWLYDSSAMKAAVAPPASLPLLACMLSVGFWQMAEGDGFYCAFEFEYAFSIRVRKTR